MCATSEMSVNDPCINQLLVSPHLAFSSLVNTKECSRSNDSITKRSFLLQVVVLGRIKTRSPFLVDMEHSLHVLVLEFVLLLSHCCLVFGLLELLKDLIGTETFHQ